MILAGCASAVIRMARVEAQGLKDALPGEGDLKRVDCAGRAFWESHGRGLGCGLIRGELVALALAELVEVDSVDFHAVSSRVPEIRERLKRFPFALRHACRCGKGTGQPAQFTRLFVREWWVRESTAAARLSFTASLTISN